MGLNLLPSQVSPWVGKYVDMTLINGTVLKSVLIKSMTPISPTESAVTYTVFQNGFPIDNSIQGSQILVIQQASSIGSGGGTGGGGGGGGGGGTGGGGGGGGSTGGGGGGMGGGGSHWAWCSKHPWHPSCHHHGGGWHNHRGGYVTWVPVFIPL